MLRSFALLVGLGSLVPAQGQLPAFPGAEGFGSTSNGGRGGDVYTVTNLNASGAGSFVNGIQTAPPSGRTIVFAVSGHFRLPSGSGGGLSIDKDKITIAGQTAPGDGICFWNNTMNLTGDDLIIRHLRWRYGKQAAGGDSVDIANSQRIILDHCDVMFSTDENLSSFGTPPEFFTFQWSVNAWGLSGHSCGGLWDINHATAHHTLWANNHTRNPKCISPSVFDWVNNVSFGWNNGFNMAASTDPTARVNIRGSWFIHGGNTTEAVYGGGLNASSQNIFKLHMSDSALDGSANAVLDTNRTNYGMVNSTSYDQAATAWPQTLDGVTGGPVIGTPVTLDPRRTAHKKVLSQVGATRMEIGSRPLRDEITQLCVNRTAAMQRGIISDPLELNLATGTAFASLQSAPAPADTDLDGMPDSWEDAVGYNKALADHNTVLTAPESLVLPHRLTGRIHAPGGVSPLQSRRPRHCRQEHRRLAELHRHRPPQVHLRLHLQPGLLGLQPHQRHHHPKRPWQCDRPLHPGPRKPRPRRLPLHRHRHHRRHLDPAVLPDRLHRPPAPPRHLGR
jgi:hypothetical protein